MEVLGLAIESIENLTLCVEALYALILSARYQNFIVLAASGSSAQYIYFCNFFCIFPHIYFIKFIILAPPVASFILVFYRAKSVGILNLQ